MCSVMTIHVICLEKENAEATKRIGESYPASHSISSTSFLVRTDDVSDKVAANVGIKGDNRSEEAVGVVLKLNGAYAGFASSSIWEWLALEAQE